MDPTECCCVLDDPSRLFSVNPPSLADVLQISALLVILAAHLDVLPAPWIPAGLYGVLTLAIILFLNLILSQRTKLILQKQVIDV